MAPFTLLHGKENGRGNKTSTRTNIFSGMLLIWYKQDNFCFSFHAFSLKLLCLFSLPHVWYRVQNLLDTQIRCILFRYLQTNIIFKSPFNSSRLFLSLVLVLNFTKCDWAHHLPSFFHSKTDIFIPFSVSLLKVIGLVDKCTIPDAVAFVLDALN